MPTSLIVTIGIPLRSWIRSLDTHSLVSNSMLTFGIRVAAAISVYLTYLLLARSMSPTMLGYFVLAQAALWLASSFAALGLDSGANRFIPSAMARGKASQITGYISWSRKIVLGSTLACGLLCAAAVWFADKDLSSPYSPLILTAAASLPFAALTSLNGSIARSLNWVLFSSVTKTFLRPFSFLVALAALYFIFDIQLNALIAMKVQLALLVCVLIGQSIGLRQKLKPLNLPSRQSIQKSVWLKISLALLVAEIYYAFYIDVHVLVSGLFLKPADLAILNAILRTLSIVAFASAAVGISFAPKVAHLYADREFDKLVSAARQAIALTLGPAVVVILVLVIFGEFVLALFGPEYVIGYQALLIASIAQLAIAFATPLLPMLGMTGKHLELFWISIVTAVFVVIAHAILTTRFGIIGSATALLIASIAWSAALYSRVTINLKLNLFSFSQTSP